MAEELRRKKNVRGGHRASATKMMNKVEDLLGVGGSLNIQQLNQIGMSLKEKLEEIKSLDSEILALVEDGELEGEIERADLYKERIYANLIRIDKAISPGPTLPPTMIGVTPATATATSMVTPPATTNKVRLPKLTIKPFNGKLTAWSPFWDSFNSAIHKNPDLSKVDKFNYLRSMVTHVALEAISGLTLTDANYDEAIEILTKRYGNKQLIINKHMEQLLSTEAVTSQHDVRGLRHLYDLVESNVRSLKSLEVQPESYGSLLSSVLMNKLPAELRLIASRKFADQDSWKFSELLTVIEEEVKARERSTLRSLQDSRPHDSRSHSRSSSQEGRRTKEQATGAALFIDSAIPKCCFCQREHSSQDCLTVSGVESRREILRRNGRCYICLGRGHISRNCRSRIKCHNCKGRHHVALCSNKSKPDTGTSKIKDGSNQSSGASESVSENVGGLNPGATTYNPPSTRTLWTYSDKHVLLQTAQAIVFNPDCPSKKLRVRIVMDTGSQKSYVTDRVSERLTLNSAGEQCLSIVTFGALQGESQNCQYFKVGLLLKNGQSQIVTLYSVPVICEPLKSHSLSECIERYPHLNELEFADDHEGLNEMQVDILIGSDHYWDLTTGRVQRGSDGPVAIHTRLGWVLSGPITVPGLTKSSHSLVTHTLYANSQLSEAQTLNETMKSFWELESFGIPTTDPSLFDEFCDTVAFREGRYEVQLPWKKPRQDLPNNYELSLKRLKGLLRRLRNDPDVLREYDTVIKTQLNQGIVELVEDPTGADIAGVHYLPHHAVIRKDRTTTKLRVVYDASARAHGPSLNDCLNPGPKFDQNILDLLMRFRAHRVAVTSDIEKAFLMISVATRDRDFLRFLWVDDPSKEDPTVLVHRFTRVVFGVSCSPFLLNATVQHHLELHSETHSNLIWKILRSIYVDDIVTSLKTEEQAYEFYVDAKALLKTGAFNLRKFSTNLSSLQDRVDSEESGYPVSPSGTTESFSQAKVSGTQKIGDGDQRVLGINWRVSSDQIVYSFDELASQAQDLEPTKRNVVSLIGRFYDPLGFIAPIVVRYKVFMQTLCEAKIGWDETVPEPLLDQWKKLVASLTESKTMTISRCYLDGVNDVVSSYQLCGYCDASLSAYAAVVYLLIETEERAHKKFVVAKTRVSPLKKQSVPRLELLSTVLLARLMATVKTSLSSELEISTCHCFTDSQVALGWIRNEEKSWKPFVQNRVAEIRSLMPVKCWKHIPGIENPADIPSRGAAPLDLFLNKLWRNGPEFPLENAVVGKFSEDCISLPPECIEELRVNEKRSIQFLLASETAEKGVQNLINVHNFSDVNRLIRVLSYVLEFCSLVRKRIVSTSNKRKFAEILLIQQAQVTLKRHKNFAIWKKQFFLFEDDSGVLRCQGRIGNAVNLPYSTKHPVILPGDHQLTTLYIRRAHERVLHNGVKETLAELRSQFWVIRGRSIVKRLLHSCYICRRYEGGLGRVPPPPPLPAFRVHEAPPFTNTGVDYAGPLYVRNSGRSQSKVWIVLYTCCVTRAIHLDLVSDMSAPTFIRSFKRFSARRGLPAQMLSDNGKSFKAAAKLIKKVVSSPQVQSYFDGIGVEWRFNVPKAPWWGGVFERLVRSTKRCLRKALGQAKLSYDELLTALIEIEMVLNSRPLTYISADDLEEPLTPSHLLMGRRLMNFPDHLAINTDHDTEFGEDDCQLNSRLKYLNRLLDAFWRRWRREYLLELREAHRHHRSKGETELSEGDIVLVYTENQPRSNWKLGRIEHMIVGADNQKRAATVRISKKGRTSTLNRPIQHLYPLEVGSHSDIVTDSEQLDEDESHVTTPEPTDANMSSHRPARPAAAQARDRILAQYMDETEELSD